MTIRVVFSRAGANPIHSAHNVGVESIIAAELERPDDELDYTRAKLASIASSIRLLTLMPRKLN